MKKMIRCFFLLLCCGLQAATGKAQKIFFIENKGQWNAEARYRVDAPSAALFLTEKGLVYNCVAVKDLDRIHHLVDNGTDVAQEKVHQHAYRVNFAGMKSGSYFSQKSNDSYHENFIRGNDPGQWVGNATACETVTQHEIYTGINFSIYSKGSSIKYDFEVSPEGNAADIILAYDGVTPQLTKDGHLLIKTSVNEIKEEAPYAYQVINDKEVKVPCFYKIKGQQVSFSLPQGYNHKYPLIIDPALIFSTYSGAQTSSFYSFSTTYDNHGNLYAGGQAWGIGWPVSSGAFQTLYAANTDLSIIKYDSAGTTRMYATYYGGDGQDLPHAMVTNGQGELFIVGSTSSTNLPVTSGCFRSFLSGSSDIFVAHFNSTGSGLLGATYIGGSGSGGEPIGSNFGGGSATISAQFVTSPCELLLDGNQNIWVVSASGSGDFPVTSNAAQPVKGGGVDGVIFQLGPNCSQLLYSTYYGGNNHDGILNCQFNSSGKLVFCGSTNSNNLVTSATALHPAMLSYIDGFVAIMDTTTHAITSATYLGTVEADMACKLQINLNNDQIYVLGQTLGNYPVTTGNYAMPNTDMFIDVLSADLSSSITSTRLGKAQTGQTFNSFFPTAFLRDICGNIYVAGMNPNVTPNYSMPLTPNAFQTSVSRFWFGSLNLDLSALTFGTYLGSLMEDHTHVGIHRFDPNGVIYHSICSTNPTFPITAGSWSPIKQNNTQLDMISFKFSFNMMDLDAAFQLAPGFNDTACAPYAPEVVNLSYGATDYIWNFDDGTTSDLFEPQHNFADSGLYHVKLIAYNAECLLSDTAVHDIFIKPTYKPELVLRDTFICDPNPIKLTAQISNYIPGTVSYQWQPASAVVSTSNNGQFAIVNPALSNVFTINAGTSLVGECIDTSVGTITISLFDYSGMYALPVDTNICPGDTVPMRAYGGTSYLWSPDVTVSTVHEPFAFSWPENDIKYEVLITNDSGCHIARAVNINIYPPAKIDAGNDQNIKYGESATLHAYCELPYMWTPAGTANPPNSLNPKVSPLQTTTYYLYITSSDGCQYMDSVTVHVTNAMLPNAFSPNGDGINDVYKLIPHDERVHLKDFSIYNRFGQRVFFTRDINEGWDGYYNGKMADLDVYFYMVHYIIGENTYPLKGDVTLVR
jgi:gliding motility-associated-like protein